MHRPDNCLPVRLVSVGPDIQEDTADAAAVSNSTSLTPGSRTARSHLVSA
ncbi:hypothetical protein [Streptomyces sp. SAS_260]